MYVRMSLEFVSPISYPEEQPLDSAVSIILSILVPSIAADSQYLALKRRSRRLHLSKKLLVTHQKRAPTGNGADCPCGDVAVVFGSHSRRVTTPSSTVHRVEHATDRGSCPFIALRRSLAALWQHDTGCTRRRH